MIRLLPSRQHLMEIFWLRGKLALEVMISTLLRSNPMAIRYGQKRMVKHVMIVLKLLRQHLTGISLSQDITMETFSSSPSIDDRYAYKDSTFTFKIPVSGDSLNHGYSPLKVPSGMTVSTGGTISWTPKTDSVYMDHVEFLVMDDIGNKDTLTFNIFVNSKNKPTATKPLSRPIQNKNQAFSIMQTSSSQIIFTLPSGASNIDIYDIHGRCVQRLKPTSAQTVWNGLSAAGSPVSSGRYFAKIKEGKTSRMGQFMIVR